MRGFTLTKIPLST